MRSCSHAKALAYSLAYLLSVRARMHMCAMSITLSLTNLCRVGTLSKLLLRVSSQNFDAYRLANGDVVCYYSDMIYLSAGYAALEMHFQVSFFFVR